MSGRSLGKMLDINILVLKLVLPTSCIAGAVMTVADNSDDSDTRGTRWNHD